MPIQGNKIVSKDHLIERVKKNNKDNNKLISKIIRQIKQAKKKPNARQNIEWKQAEAHLKEIVKVWEEKQTQKIIDEFLEEIKSSLQKKEDVLLWGYFSLKVYKTPKRMAISPTIARQLRDSNLSPRKKNELEKKKMVEVPPRNRISFRASSKLKREIN